MAEVATRVAELRREGTEAIAQARDVQSMEELRVRYLGRKAELTGILRSIGERRRLVDVIPGFGGRLERCRPVRAVGLERFEHLLFGEAGLVRDFLRTRRPAESLPAPSSRR